MGTKASAFEFRTNWLPHVTNAGLNRLIDLLKTGSPLLIHGTFTQACGMGCLATHIGWHHPSTTHFNEEAGVRWLTKVAGMNPATSKVVLEWDRSNRADWQFRAELLHLCQEERESRSAGDELHPTKSCQEFLVC
jgi:hypothetical protein